jgi:CheY-like chemotaxis protein
MMGGDITVESESGKGTAFTIRIPTVVREPAEEAAEPAGGAAPTGAVAAPGGSGTVLVIDDDAGTRDLLRRFLTREGYRVECAASGEQGLRLARELRPEVITLDVMMPGMDGWAVLSSLKSDPALAATPVVMLTIVDEYRTGYALGAADYLTKPVDRERLVAVLAKYHHEDAARLALVVEDDRVTRQMMRRMLEREGWEVMEAPNGRAGLGRVAERLPGVILLDLMMPWMDGFAFVEELRAREAWRGVPVVVVTAKELTKAERQRLSGRVSRILQKGSYSQEELMREVSRLVGSSVGTTTRKQTNA